MEKICGQIDYQHESSQVGNGYFTPTEQDTIAYYRELLVTGRAFIGNRPFLGMEAKIRLILEGLSPSRASVLEELGSVWGFFNLRSRFPRDIDVLADQLGIKPEQADGLLKPRKKFEIYANVLLFCYDGI